MSSDRTEPSRRSGDLPEKVYAWLQDEGYPLEFATADAFRKAGFRVLQGEYTQPTRDAPRREVDVVASMSSLRGRDQLLRVEYVVECKWSGDKPWVLFSSGRGMTTAACVTQSIGTRLAEALLWKEAGNDELADLEVFSASRERSAYGGRQAFSRSRDLVFDAIRAVTESCRAFADEYDSGYEHELQAGRLPRNAVVSFPVIVVEGRLFKAHQSREGLRLAEVPAARVHWRGSERHRLGHATLDIVRSDRVEEFAKTRASDARTLLDVMSSARTELQERLAEGRLDRLAITPGSRGMTGYPPLIHFLLHRLRSQTGESLEAGKDESAASGGAERE
ncbi:MAG TPA: hypothetical protein VGO48_17455 [Conexibacter sp.]|jgi:hypothetical protein|nr:hypothetical protein [Conexibacter sp.]